MNQEEFEREALRIANGLMGENVWRNDMPFANAIRDLVLRDLSEDNPPVGYINEVGAPVLGQLSKKDHHLLIVCGGLQELYAKPPVRAMKEM